MYRADLPPTKGPLLRGKTRRVGIATSTAVPPAHVAHADFTAAPNPLPGKIRGSGTLTQMVPSASYPMQVIVGPTARKKSGGGAQAE